MNKSQKFNTTPPLKPSWYCPRFHMLNSTCERTQYSSLVWKQHHCMFKCSEWLFTSNPHTSVIVQNLNFSCFWQMQCAAATELVKRLHLPLSPRVSPTGQVGIDWQRIYRTIASHLLPFAPIQTHTHARTSTHSHSHRDTLTSTDTLTDIHTYIDFSPLLSVFRSFPASLHLPKWQGRQCSAAELSLCSVSVCAHARICAFASKHT